MHLARLARQPIAAAFAAPMDDLCFAELAIPTKTLSFSGLPAPLPLTLANSRLCSAATRPGIETRYLE
jgi:hypothetical protein